MKQVLQDLRTGEFIVEDVPTPRVPQGHLLIRTLNTLVSTGTERMLVEFGKANYLNKARQQPDKVKQVLDKVKTDGLAPTIKAVRTKLEQPLPMGYSNVGVVLEVGAGVTEFSIGDRVVSNGKHAEVVAVPKNLCAKIPAGVSDEAAAFTVVGAIALQGVRLAQPTLGEGFVVTGLGLIGLVAVQLLKTNGCRVLGIDIDTAKIELARRMGAETVDLSKGEDAITAAQVFSRGRGVDGVLITASTKSNEPVHQAATMCRKRGRIVLVGVVGLELSRADFYEKELSFQVSCSYGPGRYDPAYEDQGLDYPIGFVRWTEQRNFEAVLDMLADRRFDPSPLISHRFELHEVKKAYNLVSTGSPLGILLKFPHSEDRSDEELRHRTVSIISSGRTTSNVRVGFIGAGNYATQVLIPAFAETKVELASVASSTGVSAVHVAKKFRIAQSTTDTDALIANPDVNTLVISTRHNSHALFVCAGLRAGKNIFVEKPLAITRQDLAEIERAYQEAQKKPNPPLLMVGFNRRFAPHIQKLKYLLELNDLPKSFIMTVNAGAIPRDHWTQDRDVGGGRIIGECCHFVDLLRFLAGTPVMSAKAVKLGAVPGIADCEDTMSISLEFANGSIGTIHYFANGHRSFPKERMEVFAGQSILQVDNFRKMRGFNWPKFTKMNLMSQDKGNNACAAAFAAAVSEGSDSPIPFEVLAEVARVCIDVVEGTG
jgi:predicted dehydrogenase/threonine dehydrogenase-like Zn-dependent dehydrogenase